MAIELTRAQETQLRRTGREAMEKVMAAAQQATSNGIQRATAKVTAVNDDYTVDVDFGTDEYPMKLTGLRYTTGCFGVKAGERVLVDTVGNQPLVTAVLANADNGPYVKLWSTTVSSASKVGISAPDLSGWQFAFWLQPSTLGYVGSAYVEPAYRQTTVIWSYSYASGNSIRITAVYFRKGAVTW